MPRGDYPRELSKKDPLRTEHIKVPESTLATLDSMAARRLRSRSWVIREILTDAAVEYRKNGLSAAGERDAAGMSGAAGKRRA